MRTAAAHKNLGEHDSNQNGRPESQTGDRKQRDAEAWRWIPRRDRERRQRLQVADPVERDVSDDVGGCDRRVLACPHQPLLISGYHWNLEAPNIRRFIAPGLAQLAFDEWGPITDLLSLLLWNKRSSHGHFQLSSQCMDATSALAMTCLGPRLRRYRLSRYRGPKRSLLIGRDESRLRSLFAKRPRVHNLNTCGMKRSGIAGRNHKVIGQCDGRNQAVR